MSKSEKYSVSQNETADELAAHLGKVSFDEDELSSKITTMRKQLNSLECPFTWWPSQTICRDEGNFARVQKERDEMQDEEMYEYIHWRTFVLNLVLCYEYHKKGCISESLLELNECENILKSRLRGDAGSIPLVGLWHVCLACKCFVQFESGQYVQAEQTLAEIRLPVQMTEREQAVLWGCRAAFCMEYGSVGIKQAVDHAKRALQLDPEQGEWHFLLGKALIKTRCIDKYSGEELIALERAVVLSNSPEHILFLAQLYEEIGEMSCDQNDLTNDYRPLYKRSLELYRKAVELKPKCCRVNICCASGFLKIMWPYCNIDLAKECIDRALSVAPDNKMAHLVAGMYFQYYRVDLEQAKKHYTLAGEKGAYSGSLKLLQTKYQQNHSYNPVPDLEKLLEQYQESPGLQETLCQLGSYHCFVKNDPKTALGYWQRAVKLDPESARLQNHLCLFVNLVMPVNIHELVLDEARLIIQSNSGSAEDLAMWRKVISDYAVSHPELGQRPPVRREERVNQSI